MGTHARHVLPALPMPRANGRRRPASSAEHALAARVLFGDDDRPDTPAPAPPPSDGSRARLVAMLQWWHRLGEGRDTDDYTDADDAKGPGSTTGPTGAGAEAEAEAKAGGRPEFPLRRARTAAAFRRDAGAEEARLARLRAARPADPVAADARHGCNRAIVDGSMECLRAIVARGGLDLNTMTYIPPPSAEGEVGDDVEDVDDDDDDDDDPESPSHMPLTDEPPVLTPAKERCANAHLWEYKAASAEHELGLLAAQVMAYISRIIPGVSQAAYDLFVGDVDAMVAPPPWTVYATSIAHTCNEVEKDLRRVCNLVCWSVVVDPDTGRPVRRDLIRDMAFAPQFLPRYPSTIARWEQYGGEDAHFLLCPVYANKIDEALYILAKKVFAAGRDEMMHRTLRAADGIIDGRQLDGLRKLVEDVYEQLQIDAPLRQTIELALFPNGDVARLLPQYCKVASEALMDELKVARSRGWSIVPIVRSLETLDAVHKALTAARP